MPKRERSVSPSTSRSPSRSRSYSRSPSRSRSRSRSPSRSYSRSSRSRSYSSSSESDHDRRRRSSHYQRDYKRRKLQYNRDYPRFEPLKDVEPQRSVQGWIIFVRNIHEEANEDDLIDLFSEYGTIRNVGTNLDRKTGFFKGYALIEFEEKDEAQKAIQAMNGKDFRNKKLQVDWAFITPKVKEVNDQEGKDA